MKITICRDPSQPSIKLMNSLLRQEKKPKGEYLCLDPKIEAFLLLRKTKKIDSQSEV